MDQIFEIAKIAVLPNLKLWEPQKAYEKRLGAIMAKENREFLESIGSIVVLLTILPAHAPKTKRTRKKAGTGDDETDGEVADEAGGMHKQRTSRRVTRSNPSGGMDESTGDEEPATPKAKPRPRPRPVRRQKTPSETGAAEENVTMVESFNFPASSSSPSRVQEAEEIVTPQSSRKRPRNEDEEMSEAPNGRESAPLGSPEEPEIEVRRKRVRH